MIVRKDLDPELRKKVEAFMFSYGVGDTPEAKRQAAILEKIQTRPFVRADASHLIPVREMEATGQLIAARNKKDAAGIAAAEAALAQVRREKGGS